MENFKTETISTSGSLDWPRPRFIDLPAEWKPSTPGSTILDLNYPDETFEFRSWYQDKTGPGVIAVDSSGATRHFYGDSIRLTSLTGRQAANRKRGITTLSASEKRLSRAEKRRLRRERRAAANTAADKL
jgi:hypothetical protein